MCASNKQWSRYEDDATVVDTTRTVVGGTVTQREIEELPNNTRNRYDFVFTLGGVTEEPLSTRDLSEDPWHARQSSPGKHLKKPEFSLCPAARLIQITSRLTDLIITMIVRLLFVFNRRSNRFPKFRLLPINFPPNTVGLRAVASTFAPAPEQRFRGRAFFFFRDESLNANT